MARPLPKESVVLRAQHPLLPKGAHFKVTARYTVDLDGERSLRCVRVRCYESNMPIVLHLSEQRFGQLFVSDDERKPRRGRGRNG